MLRIMISEGPIEQRWIVQGRLEAPWVEELETSWKTRRRRAACRCVVDLTNVTSIDDRGKKVLKAMRRTGVEFIASGVYAKHIIELISSNYKFK
jgi:hypothetical protein